MGAGKVRLMHFHSHDHHGHNHGHDHRHHDHASAWTAATRDQGALVLAIGLNLLLVAGEFVFGWISGSLALIADAAHNLSDCMTLMLAWLAMWLAQKKPNRRYTYGLGGSTILATTINGVILIVIAGFLAFSAYERLLPYIDSDHAHEHTHEISTGLMMSVALVAAVLNIATAWLFNRSRRKDINLQGVYIHMIIDAAVSVGVVFTALGIESTGWTWLDPTVTIVIVLALGYATYSLLTESFKLLLQAVPQHIDAEAALAHLKTLPNVTAVHDFHVWALSTREVAMTAHLIMPAGHPGDAFLAETAKAMAEKFGIVHTTLQIETSPHEVPCALDGHTHG
jgi:cobalt-zinc-cadmium efflux system protein